MTSGGGSPQAQLIWRRSLALGEAFDQDNMFAIVLDLLRTAGHDANRLMDALVLGRSRVSEHPSDFVAHRACGFLQRAITFVGGSGAASTLHNTMGPPIPFRRPA